MPVKVLFLWLIFFAVACGAPDPKKINPADDLSAKADELLETVRSSDYHKADSLAEWLISQAEASENYEILIDARTYKSISLYSRRYMEDAYELIHKNLETIEEYGLPRQKAYALVQLSNMYKVDNRQREALETVNEAIDLIPAIDDNRTVAAVYATKAAVISQRDPVEALQLNYKALKSFEEEEDIRSVATARNNIALMHHRQQDFESALEQFNKAIALSRSVGDREQLAVTYNNAANSLSSIGNKEAAADSLLKAIEINQNLGISPRLIQNYYNLAKIFIDTEDYDLAHAYFSQAYEESKSINFLPGIMYHSSGLARLYSELEEYEKVPEYNEESREIAERLENLDVLAESWDIQATMMENQGDYEGALAAHRRVQVYSDSIDNIRREREFEEIRIARDMDLKTAENEFLRQQLSYQERLGNVQRLVLIILVVGVLFTGVLLFVIFRNQRKLQNAYFSLEQKNKIITSKNKQLVALNNDLKQLNNEKDQLIGIIVHDLRNPLFGIIGFLDVISESVTDSGELEHLEMARKSAYRLNSLINSLLDVHSLEKENDYRKLEKVDTKTVITQALSDFTIQAKKKRIEVQPELINMTVDFHPPYLIRIVDNLVSNAIKFSPPDTRVTVITRIVQEDFWQLEVSDEGPGLSENDKKKMFQMFGKLSTRPTDGEESTGLGLYTVNMLVERLNGSISVKSEQGKGSRFICEFPIRQIDIDPNRDPYYEEVSPDIEMAEFSEEPRDTRETVT